MKLSASLIVRNESQMLPACLESIKDMDEIIVVDTGSTDNTNEIARSYGARVFTYEWNDDFAAARNESLKYCTGDWVLSIDADELLITPIIKNQLKGDGMYLSAESNSDTCKLMRLFKNSPGVKWFGSVHEELIGTKDVHNSPFMIKCRTSPNHLLDPQRNIRILRRAIASGERVEMNMYYMGLEWLRLGEFAQSLEYLTRFVKTPAPLMDLADAWLCIAVNQVKLQNYEAAMDASLMAIKHIPGLKAAWAIIHNIALPVNKPMFAKFFHAADNKGIKVHRPYLDRLN